MESDVLRGVLTLTVDCRLSIACMDYTPLSGGGPSLTGETKLVSPRAVRSPKSSNQAATASSSIAGSSVDPAITNKRCKLDTWIQVLVFIYPPAVFGFIVAIAYQARSQSSINGFSLALGFISLCAIITFGIMRMTDARARTRMWSVITWSALVACGCSVPWGMGWQGWWFYDSLPTASGISLASISIETYASTVAFRFDTQNVTVVPEWGHSRYFNETYTTPDGTIVHKLHKTYVVPLYDTSVADALERHHVGQWMVNEEGPLPVNHSRLLVGLRANPDDVHMYYDTVREAAAVHGLDLPLVSSIAFLRNKDPDERLNYYTLLIIGGAAAALPIYLFMMLSLWCCTPPPSNSFKSKYT